MIKCAATDCTKMAENAVGVAVYPHKAVMKHYRSTQPLSVLVLGLEVCKDHLPKLEDFKPDQFEPLIVLLEKSSGTVADRKNLKIVTIAFTDPNYIALKSIPPKNN